MDIDGIQPAARRSTKRSIGGSRPATVSARPAPKITPRGAQRLRRSGHAPGSQSAHLRQSPPARPQSVYTHQASQRLRVRPEAKVLAPASTAQTAASSSSIESKRLHVPRYHAPERFGTGASKTSKTQKAKAARKGKQRWSVRRIVWSGVGAFAVAVLSVGGFLTWRAYANLHKVFRGNTTVAVLSNKPVVPAALKTEGDGRVNILLLGIGGPGHQGPDLTDTIVVMSIDPVNNSASMLSVPRDLWVKQPVNYFGAVQKINAAYESGKYHYIGKLDAGNENSNAVQAGFASIDQVIKNVLDVHVNYHVLVNFQAFRQSIDTVGGVTVDVPTQLYDPTMAWENHNNSILAPAGVQQMDGVKALLYARSRETTSDFARAERQRQILVALKDKVLSAGTLSNPAKIEGLMNAFGDNVYSDLSTQGATKLFGIIKNVNDTQIASIDLTQPPHKLVTTDRVGTTSVVRPLAGYDNYGDIQAFVRSQLPDGYLVKEHAPVTVVAPTAAGATAAANLLKSYGYSVTATGTATSPVAGPVVVDWSSGKYPFTAHYLQGRYAVTPVRTLPDGVIVAPGSAKFVIIVPK